MTVAHVWRMTTLSRSFITALMLACACLLPAGLTDACPHSCEHGTVQRIAGAVPVNVTDQCAGGDAGSCSRAGGGGVAGAVRATAMGLAGKPGLVRGGPLRI